MSSSNDGLHWKAFAHVDKYSPDQVRYAFERLGHEPKGWELQALFGEPENGTAEAAGNLLTTAGLQRVTNLIIGSGAQGMTSTRTAVGVGSTTTAATTSDTALGADGTTANGTVGARYQVVDSAPTAVNGVITCVCTYSASTSDFAWQEWCWAITNGAITADKTLASIGTTPQIINHKIASLGTKAGGSWVLTTTVTLS